MSSDETDTPTEQREADEDGDRACYAHLVCPECGAVVTEGHRPDCSLAAAEQGS